MSDPANELTHVLQALLDGVPETTARRLSEQLWRSPRNPFTFAALGVALAELGQTPAALAAFERAHYLQPDSAHILYHYGLVLLADKRPHDAKLRFQAALRLSPGLEEARIRLAALEQLAPGVDITPTRHASAPPARPPSPRSIAPETPVLEPSAPQRAAVAPSIPRPDPPRAAVQTRLPARSEPEDLEGEEDEELDEAPYLDWEPEPQPSAPALAQGTLRTWGQQPLLWLCLLAVPSAAAEALISLKGFREHWLVALIWTCALCLGAVPTLAAMASQYVYEKPFATPWRLTPLRFFSGLLVLLPYLLVTVHLPCVQLCRVLPFPCEAMLPATLLLGLPLHALLAPAFISSVTGGASGFQALRAAFCLAGRRTWLHLGVMLATGLVLGGSLALISLAFTGLLRGAGTGVMAVLLVAGVALAESVWAVLVAACGVDALKPIAPPPDPDDPEPMRRRISETS